MKIAIPTKGSEIDSHFGHCDHFTVFNISENGEIISKSRVDSPAGCGCKSNIAQTLADSGVSLMLAGHMGDGAVRVLDSKGIKVIRGCAGSTDAAVQKWIAGSLHDSGVNCAEHGHDCSH